MDTPDNLGTPHPSDPSPDQSPDQQPTLVDASATPVAPAGPPAGPVKDPNDQRNLYVGIGAVVVILLCVCGLCAGMLHGGSSSTAAQVNVAVATATPAPTATETPTPDPNGHPAVQRYTALVGADSTTLGQDMSQVGSDCQAASNDISQLPVCRQDVVQVQTDVRSYESDLEGITAPACLKKTDRLLRQALPLYDSGSQDMLNGIDNVDTSQMNAGVALYQQANGLTNQATAAANIATCP